MVFVEGRPVARKVAAQDERSLREMIKSALGPGTGG
jgi:hypothetical protein